MSIYHNHIDQCQIEGVNEDSNNNETTAASTNAHKQSERTSEIENKK